MELQELRRNNYEMAEAIAPGWERQLAFVESVAAPVREWLTRELAPRPGDTVLELAAGAGDTGFDAAEIVGEHGRVISTDFSPTMVDVARRRAPDLGMRTVEPRVMDAERIELEDDSVDGVICRYGYMLMPDRAAALSETRRVLRPGGRLALAVWGAPERNPFFAIVGMLLVQRGHMPPPEPGGPGIFSMASEEAIRERLSEAGFGSIRIEEVPVRFAFASVDEYMTITTDTAGPLAMALRALPEDERGAIAEQLESAFASFATERGYELPGATLAEVSQA